MRFSSRESDSFWPSIHSSYGLGTIFRSGKGAFKEYYELVLPSLFKIAKSFPDSGERDIALSCLAKMIAVGRVGLPVSEIALLI
jgi:hypothetical protein